MAEKAEHLKSAKYAALKVSHHFFALETSGLLSQTALALYGTLGNACVRQQGRNAARSTSSKESPLQYRGGMLQQCLGP